MLPRSFSLRIFLLNFGLLILPLLFYFLLIFRWEFDGRVEKVLFELHDIGDARAALISERVSHEFLLVDFLEDTLQLSYKKASSLDIQKTLDSIKNVLATDEIAYYSFQGHFIQEASVGKVPIGNENILLQPYLEEAIQNGTSVNFAYSLDQVPLLYVAKTIYSQNEKKPIGVFIIKSSVQAFLDALTNPKTFGFDARYSVLTHNDMVFSSSDHSFIRRAIWPLPSGKISIISAEMESEKFPLHLEPLGLTPIKEAPDSYKWQEFHTVRIGVFIPVKGTSIVLLLDASRDAINQEIYHEIGSIFLVFCIIVVIVTLLNLWVIKQLSKPLNQLFDVMAQIGKGDYKTRYKSCALGYEINKIGTTLNQMIDSLIHYMDTVKNEGLKKEALSKELSIGRDIQMSMLPQEMPQIPGVQVAGRVLPANEAGGDFYDVYMQNQRLFVSIGDALGKGIYSCLYSFGLRSMLRSYGLQQDNDVAKMMLLANNLFFQDTERASVSVKVFTLIYDSQKQELEYSSAGHAPLILFRESGKIEHLNLPGEAIGRGLLENIAKESVKLFPGDLLFLYVEGIMKILGEEKTLSFIQRNRELSCDAIIDLLFKEFKEHFVNNPQTEDITVVLIKLL